MVTKKKVGRQPKQASSADGKTQSESEVSTEVKVLPADEDKEYFFESRYASDCFTLIKPSKVDHKDGSTTVNPGAVAQFDQHGWTTRSAYNAGLLRQIMEHRPETGVTESATNIAHHASMARRATEARRRLDGSLGQISGTAP